MTMLRRMGAGLVALALCNWIILSGFLPWPAWARTLCLIVLIGVFLLKNISPRRDENVPKRLRLLAGGCDLLFMGGICAAVTAIFYICLAIGENPFRMSVWVWNLVMAVLLTAVLVANALIRLFFSSSKLTVKQRIMLICLWWLPVFNILLFAGIYSQADREYRFELLRRRRNEARKDQAVCRTKYPLLMVHGIFFRDWELFNYWGRIPRELEKNGARIFYGKQESSISVEDAAKQLRDSIMEIIEKEKCEKVNIIAHSKGGLDSRYAISVLGMDRHVASLTTINTPHRGCRFAKKALDKVPESIVSGIAGKYEKIFSRLGDTGPDFYSGVSELTDEACEKLNELMPDMEGIHYQSIGSRMRDSKSASFPLNLGYSIVNAIDGDNDGLVDVKSMPWGTKYCQLEPEGRLGISHGDVIDLTRRDIKGFDVCEFYVGLVQELREMGM